MISNSIVFPGFHPIYGSWQSFKSVLYKIHSPSESSSRSVPLDLTGDCTKEESSNTQYIAFDMDGTLIKTKSGKTFGTDLCMINTQN
jgi:hypothetical protein